MTPAQALERARILLTLKHSRKALSMTKLKQETGFDESTIELHTKALKASGWITIAGMPQTFKYKPRLGELCPKRGVSTKQNPASA